MGDTLGSDRTVKVGQRDKAKGTKGWSQEEREEAQGLGRPWIHRARKHLIRWPLDNMRQTLSHAGLPQNSTPGPTLEAPSSHLQPSEPFLSEP